MVANGDDHGSRAAAGADNPRGKPPPAAGSLATFNIRSKSSSSSLRFRSPPAHTKQKPSVASSTWRGIKAKDGALSSSSSRDVHSSSSSLSLDDFDDDGLDPKATPTEGSKLKAGLGRLSFDRAVSADRLSIDQRRPLEPSPASSTRNLLDTRSVSAAPNPSAAAAAATSPNKMHQTSSRLLRMTDEERPFTRDFKDLFSTLVVSLPLSSHRVRFQKVEHTFTSEEAINNLGSLKFSQSNRMPDPKDPSRIVTTTTTTTFSMAKEMARSVCQRFMDARFIEPADGKAVPQFPLKGAVWQLTPKGIHVLQMFCQRNGIAQRHVLDLLDSPRNTMQLVMLERDPATDRLSHDRATVEVLFRRFVGQEGPNLRGAGHHGGPADEAAPDEYNGVVGVRMARERKVLDRVVPHTFTGKAAVDWLMDCCTTVERRETFEVAELFVVNGLIWAAQEDKVYVHQNPQAAKFQPTKQAVYGVTEKGQRVAGWVRRREGSPETSAAGGGGNGAAGDEKSAAKAHGAKADAARSTRDSNHHRLMVIVNDPALRLLFREFLRDTHCEENLAFFLEVREFTKHYDISDRAQMFTRLDAIRESLAGAYGTFILLHFLLRCFSFLRLFGVLRSQQLMRECRPLQRLPRPRLALRAKHRPQPAQQPGGPHDARRGRRREHAQEPAGRGGAVQGGADVGVQAHVERAFSPPPFPSYLTRSFVTDSPAGFGAQVLQGSQVPGHPARAQLRSPGGQRRPPRALGLAAGAHAESDDAERVTATISPTKFCHNPGPTEILVATSEPFARVLCDLHR